MAPQSSEAQCDTCHKHQTQLSNHLKVCAKCKTQKYCSREYQKAAWKDHKKTRSTNSSTPTNDGGPANRSQATSGKERGPCHIEKPFTALSDRSWLRARPKQDVFKLLVDLYRMRVEDDYKFKGEVDEGSLYSGGSPSQALNCFSRFLKNITKLDRQRSQPQKLLPDWWTSTDAVQECLEFAAHDEFSNVGYAVEKHDIQDHYKQPDMPMQLRMFGELLDGHLVTGQSGASMMKLQVECEKGSMFSSHLSLQCFLRICLFEDQRTRMNTTNVVNKLDKNGELRPCRS